MGFAAVVAACEVMTALGSEIVAQTLLPWKY